MAATKRAGGGKADKAEAEAKGAGGGNEMSERRDEHDDFLRLPPNQPERQQTLSSAQAQCEMPAGQAAGDCISERNAGRGKVSVAQPVGIAQVFGRVIAATLGIHLFGVVAEAQAALNRHPPQGDVDQQQEEKEQRDAHVQVLHNERPVRATCSSLNSLF